MANEVKWIEGLPRGRMTVSMRPPGGEFLEDAVKAWRSAGVSIVVSLLAPDEMARLDLLREPEFCAASGIQFLSFPVPDHSVPVSRRDTLAFALRVSGLLNQGQSILIHCLAGIGRSPLLAASVLALNGIPPRLAFERISIARGFPVPEMDEQREWAEDFAESIGLRARRDDTQRPSNPGMS